MIGTSEFVRLLVDPTRLAVLGAAAVGPVNVASLAVELDVPERRVLQAVGRLREAGLLNDESVLDPGVLREIARGLPQVEPPDPGLIDGGWRPEEAEVLSRFFSGNRLTAIPGNRSKRLVVLERLAQEFDIGVRYPEKQVNFMLQLFYPDYAALRRLLVDEELMTRADGVYWRTGGRD